MHKSGYKITGIVEYDAAAQQERNRHQRADEFTRQQRNGSWIPWSRESCFGGLAHTECEILMSCTRLENQITSLNADRIKCKILGGRRENGLRPAVADEISCQQGDFRCIPTFWPTPRRPPLLL